MKYRALLIDPSDAELKIRARQTFGQSVEHLQDWAKQVLEGRKLGARVEVYERCEALVGTITPLLPVTPVPPKEEAA